MTTKTNTKKSETVAVEDVIENTSEMTNSAREFVKKSAATAKERADSIHESAEKMGGNLEGYVNRYVSGYFSFLGGLANAAHANIEHTLTTVEKVADAKSFSEALSIQSEFVRENTSQNIDRVREAANTVREAVAEGTETVREAATKVWPTGKKAA